MSKKQRRQRAALVRLLSDRELNLFVANELLDDHPEFAEWLESRRVRNTKHRAAFYRYKGAVRKLQRLDDQIETLRLRT